MISALTGAMKRVAIIGAGISGCSAANVLCALGGGGVQVEMFDQGRKEGGRCNTRKHKHHGIEHIFDHGTQYISPKNSEFVSVIKDWEKVGIVKKWDSFRLANIACANGKSKIELAMSAQQNERFVGYPGMSAICEHLIDSELISTKFGKAVEAIRSSDGGWNIYSKDSGALIAENFDYVICSERKLCMNFMAQQSEQSTDGSPDGTSPKSSPCIVAMVCLDEDMSDMMKNMQFTAAMVDGNEKLSWISVDSSKPGRVDDGKSRLVLQSTPEFAKNIIEEVNLEFTGASVKEIRNAVVKASEAQLYNTLLDIIEDATECERGELDAKKPLFIKGHRWGAAFPALGTSLEQEGRCLVDEENGWVSIGDYFEYPGKVEGGYLSGKAGAKAVLHLLDRQAK